MVDWTVQPADLRDSSHFATTARAVPECMENSSDCLVVAESVAVSGLSTEIVGGFSFFIRAASRASLA